MGDRCYVSFRVHKEDIEHEEWKKWVEEQGTGTDSLEDGEWAEAECNYALSDERADLARKGVRFVGAHSSGGDYSAYIFLSDGKKLHEWPVDGMGDPSIAIDADCHIKEGEIERLIIFLSRFRNFRTVIDDSWKEEVNGSGSSGSRQGEESAPGSGPGRTDRPGSET